MIKKSGCRIFKYLEPLRTSRQGFTLLEMVVALGIFSVIVVTSIGIMLGVANSQIKASNIQAILDNVRFSLELITKEMRTGNNYQLTTTCSPGSEIKFQTSLGSTRVYYLYAPTNTIMRATSAISSLDCDGSTGVSQPFTSDEVIVQKFDTATQGTTVGPNDGQPWITIFLRVKSKNPKYEYASSMDLQTTIVQRFRDIQQ